MSVQKIKSIIYNWRQIGSINDNCGEDSDVFTVGVNAVEEIIEHLPRGEGDRLWYDIYINNKLAYRVFNINMVEYFS